MAFPSLFYLDPSETLDEIRAQRKKAERKAKLERRHKAARIQALVRKAMSNGGDKGDRR
jgi:hypothetical protein